MEIGQKNSFTKNQTNALLGTALTGAMDLTSAQTATGTKTFSTVKISGGNIDGNYVELLPPAKIVGTATNTPSGIPRMFAFNVTADPTAYPGGEANIANWVNPFIQVFTRNSLPPNRSQISTSFYALQDIRECCFGDRSIPGSTAFEWYLSCFGTIAGLEGAVTLSDFRPVFFQLADDAQATTKWVFRGRNPSGLVGDGCVFQVGGSEDGNSGRLFQVFERGRNNGDLTCTNMRFVFADADYNELASGANVFMYVEAGGYTYASNMHGLVVNAKGTGNHLNCGDGKFVVEDDGALNVQTQLWHRSSDAKERLYFETNGATYVKSGIGATSSLAHELRNSANTPLLQLSGLGAGTFAGKITTGIVSLDGTGGDLIIDNGQPAKIRLLGYGNDMYFDLNGANGDVYIRTNTGGTTLAKFPATKPVVSGSRGGNAALASLLSALASMSLITDSTT